MTLIGNICSSLFPNLSGDSKNREGVRGIDASIRFPLLALIISAFVWLIVATVVGFIASIKMHSPGFLADYSFLTYGKVAPIFWNSLVYGWLFNAGLACAVFLLSRLGGNNVGLGAFLTISITLWNTGVTAGIIGIMWGEQLPFQWLEFPAFAAPILFLAFLGIGTWSLLTFRARIHRSSYASQWWIIASIFSFAWIYTAAQVMLVGTPAQGAIQTLVNSWYVENVFGLVIAPLTFATLYYLLPKTLGTAVVGYKYSSWAFWSWFLFASFSGIADLANGPIPAWVSSLGVIATFGLLIPTTTMSIQFLSSLFSCFSVIWDSATARYLFVGCITFLLVMYHKIFGVLRGSLDITQFSLYDSGVTQLALFGFAGMTFTGAIYFILPRLLNKELPSTSLIDLQFWSHLMGLILVSIGLISGGTQQGELMNGSTAEALVVVKTMQSSFYLTTIGMVFFIIGAVASGATYIGIMLSTRIQEENETSLVKEAPELEYNAS